MADAVEPPFLLRFSMSEEQYSGFLHQLAVMFYSKRKAQAKVLNLFVWLLFWVGIALAMFALIGTVGPAALLSAAFFILGGLAVQLFMQWSQRQVIAGMLHGLPDLLNVKAEIGGATLRWQSGPYSFSAPLAVISQIVDFDGGLLIRAGINGVFLPSHAFADYRQKQAVLRHLLTNLTPEAAAISVKAG